MVNRVVLLGVLVEKPLLVEDLKFPYVLVKLQVAKYGRSFSTVYGRVWGKAKDWVLEKNHQPGTGVSIVGSIGAGRNQHGDWQTELTVDSMHEVPWVTEAFKKTPWFKKEDQKSSAGGGNPVR